MKTNSILKRNWSEIKMQLQFHYPWLTSVDLNYNENYENDFFTNLQMKTGQTRKQLLDELNIILMHD